MNEISRAESPNCAHDDVYGAERDAIGRADILCVLLSLADILARAIP